MAKRVEAQIPLADFKPVGLTMHADASHQLGLNGLPFYFQYADEYVLNKYRPSWGPHVAKLRGRQEEQPSSVATGQEDTSGCCDGGKGAAQSKLTDFCRNSSYG